MLILYIFQFILTSLLLHDGLNNFHHNYYFSVDELEPLFKQLGDYFVKSIHK